MTLQFNSEQEFAVITYQGKDWISELTDVQEPIGYVAPDETPINGDEVSNVEYAIAEAPFQVEIGEVLLTDTNGVAYYQIEGYTLESGFVGTRPPRRPR